MGETRNNHDGRHLCPSQFDRDVRELTSVKRAPH